MQKGSCSYIVAISVLCVSVMTLGAGCAGKRVASSSGDAASTTKPKSAAAPAVETISPDRMVTVPSDQPSTIETAPAPGDVPSSFSEGPRTNMESEPTRPMESAPADSPSSPLAPAVGDTTALTAADTAALADIHFDFDQFVVREEAGATMAANAAWIKSHPGTPVLIEGHCDERGTQAYNLVLGEKRARSAKRYLEDLGVPSSQLQITSYGEVRPFCHERNESCYQLNRRAHFVAK